jgi:hypothetical protein
MFEHIKEFIKDNPGKAVSAAAALFYLAGGTGSGNAPLSLNLIGKNSTNELREMKSASQRNADYISESFDDEEIVSNDEPNDASLARARRGLASVSSFSQTNNKNKKGTRRKSSIRSTFTSNNNQVSNNSNGTSRSNNRPNFNNEPSGNDKAYDDIPEMNAPDDYADTPVVDDYTPPMDDYTPPMDFSNPPPLVGGVDDDSDDENVSGGNAGDVSAPGMIGGGGTAPVLGGGGSFAPGAISNSDDDEDTDEIKVNEPTTCNADITVSPGPGSYVENPTITITTSADSVSYCFSKGGTCDPKTSGSTYGSPFKVTTNGFQDNGSFTLSYVARCNGLDSETFDIAYQVDNTAIPLSFSSSNMIVQLQSQETQQVLKTTSTAFGASGYAHYTYTVPTDPTLSTCEDLAYNLGYNAVNNGLRTIASVDTTDTSALLPSDDIDVPLSPLRNTNMQYGANYLVTFMEQNDPQGGTRFGCITNQVQVIDFDVVSLMQNTTYKTTPNVNNVSEFQGGVTHFGPFGSAVSGAGTSQVGTERLESGFLNIIN